MSLPPQDNPQDRPQDRPTGTLFSDALQQLSRLVRGEVGLARAEITLGLRTAAGGLCLVLAATVLAISAVNLLAGALVAALIATGVAPGWAAAGVGAALAAIALMLGFAGARALSPADMRLPRTQANLRRDAETFAETFKESVTNDPSS